MKDRLLGCWDCNSLLSWFGVLKLSQSLNLPYSREWLVHLVPSLMCWISYKNGYMQDCCLYTCCFSGTTSVFPIGINLVGVRLNWLNWLHFLILVGDPLVFLTVSTISLSPFLDVTRRSMSTVSFLVSLEVLSPEWFPSDYDPNGFKPPPFRHLLLWVLSNQLSYELFSIPFFLVNPCIALHSLVRS